MIAKRLVPLGHLGVDAGDVWLWRRARERTLGSGARFDPVVTTMPVEEEDEFPIGLLGLLGLAGLLGLKRKDDRVHHAETTNRNRQFPWRGLILSPRLFHREKVHAFL